MKKLIPYIISGTTLLSGCGNLHKEDFQKSDWIQKQNDGIIWDEYMRENIKHNRNNWDYFQYKVNERNNGILIGKVYFPDLDNDGKVGVD